MRERKRSSFESNVGSFQERKLRFPVKKYIRPSLVIIILVAAFIFGVRFFSNRDQVASSGIEVGTPQKSLDVNREFSFPLVVDSEQVSEIKYMVERVELIDQIIVKGQRYTAVKGRTFLILNLKISNDYTQPVEMKSRDYVRLSVNGNQEEWLAPDIHNDPVEVQAISTKYTRLGFNVDDDVKSIVIRIGEIEGEKEDVPLEF